MGSDGAPRTKVIATPNPMELTVKGRPPPADQASSEKTKEWWNNQWEEKAKNVNDWRQTVSHLHLFASPGRLPAQGVLVSAALVLLLFFGISLVQAIDGRGDKHLGGAVRNIFREESAAVSTVLRQIADNAEHTQQQVVNEARNTLSQARQAVNTAANSAERARLNATLILEEQAQAILENETQRLVGPAPAPPAVPPPSGRRLTPARGALEAAVIELAIELEPARAAFLDPLGRQLLAFLGAHHLDMDAFGGGASCGSRRLFGAVAAAPAALAVANISAPSVQDQAVQAGTELARSLIFVNFSKATTSQIMLVAFIGLMLLYSAPLLYGIAMVNTDFSNHRGLLEEVKVKTETARAQRMGKTGREGSPGFGAFGAGNGMGRDSAARGEASADGSRSGKGTGDPHVKYQTMLTAAMTASRRDRNPISIFGFTITMTVFSSWLMLAFVPMSHTVTDMAPHLAAAMCNQIVGNASTGMQGMVDNASHAIQHNVELLNGYITNTSQSLQVQFGQYVHNVSNMVDTAVENAATTVNGAATTVNGVTSLSGGHLPMCIDHHILVAVDASECAQHVSTGIPFCNVSGLAGSYCLASGGMCFTNASRPPCPGASGAVYRKFDVATFVQNHFWDDIGGSLQLPHIFNRFMNASRPGAFSGLANSTMDVGALLKETICNPLQQWINRITTALTNRASKSIKGLNSATGISSSHASGRRLLSLVDPAGEDARCDAAAVDAPVESLRRVVRRWWESGSRGVPAASKLVVLKLALREFELDAREQLVDLPVAVARAAEKSGPDAALHLALEGYRHGRSRGALADHQNFEPAEEPSGTWDEF